jgi:signal peptide peptidase SppA
MTIETKFNPKCAPQYFGKWLFESQRFTQMVHAVKEGLLTPKLAVEVGQEAAEPQAPYVVTSGGVAMIQIDGPMMKGASKYGGTSTVMARRAIREADADPQVRGIMIHIYSGGGTVDGTADLADDVRNSKKPVRAYIADLGASAAYWVASQTEQISANRTAEVGSIGTVAIVEDTSGMYAKAGVKVYVVSTGKYKGAFADGAPVSEDAIAYLQESVDETNQFFLRAVADGRDIEMAKLLEIADGRVYLAEKAQALGLVDVIESFDQSLSNFEETLMNENELLAKFKADHPKAAELHAQEIKAEVESKMAEEYKTVILKAEEAAIANERARCKALIQNFAEDRDFLGEQIEAGHDIPKAKAEHHDILKAKLAEVSKQSKPGVDVPNGSPSATYAPPSTTASEVSPERLNQLRTMAGLPVSN